MVKRTTLIRLSVTIIIFFLIITTALFLQTLFEQRDKKHYHFSFESDMQGWKADGTDLFHPPINWTVNRSEYLAYNGSYAIQLFLENLNDAGKIWMERNFSLKPNTRYEVNISYYLGTLDYGDVNLFTLITGISTANPETEKDITYIGDTSHHQNTTDLVWTQKNYKTFIQTQSNGFSYVFIGVWGTWETTRIYFIDEVSITFTEYESLFSIF